MPLIKSKSKKAFSKNIEAEMDAGKPQKQSLAIAYSTQRRAKKSGGGEMPSHEHTAECFAFGGIAGGTAPQCEYAKGISPQDHNTPGYAMGGSVADRIRSRYAKGGEVDGGGYNFDIQDQIEHSNYYDKRNAEIADQELYDDDYGTDPRDSNEHGHELSDADEHAKSMFRKMKMKRAQPGDRGKY